MLYRVVAVIVMQPVYRTHPRRLAYGISTGCNWRKMAGRSKLVPRPETYLLSVGRDKTRSELLLEMRTIARIEGSPLSDEIWDAMYMYSLRWKRDNSDRTAEFTRAMRIVKEGQRGFQARVGPDGEEVIQDARVSVDLVLKGEEADAWVEGMEVEAMLDRFDDMEGDEE